MKDLINKVVYFATASAYAYFFYLATVFLYDRVAERSTLQATFWNLLLIFVLVISERVEGFIAASLENRPIATRAKNSQFGHPLKTAGRFQGSATIFCSK